MVVRFSRRLVAAGALAGVILLSRLAWADGPGKSIFDFDDDKPGKAAVKPTVPVVVTSPPTSTPPVETTPTPPKTEDKPADEARPAAAGGGLKFTLPPSVTTTPVPPVGPGGGSSASSLLPVPDAKAQERVLRQVKEQFKTEYRSVGAERAAVARTLLQAGVGGGTDAETGFVLLKEAKDMASAAGDARTGLAAARQIAARYATDLTEMGLGVLQAASRNATTPDRAADVAAVAMTLVGRAADAQQFDLGIRIAAIAEASARFMRSPALANNLQLMQKDLRTRKANADKLPAAREALKHNPADPDACGVVGRHLCLEEGNWGEGLSLLAKGSDATLKVLAQREAALPSDPAAQAELANQWWAMAQTQPVTARLRMQQRAAEWYGKALPGLLGVKKDQAAARVASAERVMQQVVLMSVPVAADPAKARREREALARGAEPVVQDKLTESWAVDADKPHLLTQTLSVPDKVERVDVTMGPGAELRGGKIYLNGRGHLIIRGSPERPAVLRDVTISMDLNGSFDAEYAVLDGCTFKKEGGWFAYYSSKWKFKNCTLARCKFASLWGQDYGIKIEACRMIGMTFPEITHKHDAGKEYNHLDKLRHDWNKIGGCEFVDCAVTPTVAWCAEDSNFIGCKFLPGEAFEGNEAFEWRAFVGETIGETPQAVWDARPGTRAKVKVVAMERAADVPRVGEKLLPEITYATKAVARND